MDDLTKKKCVPCEGGTPPLEQDAIQQYLPKVPGWGVAADLKSISREFQFNDFKRAVAFVNEVADLAEFEGHHPDIAIWYNKVKLTLSTHAIEGLSENDFILAAKINQVG
jgi:4a-hydroxytetrahydrobiopterin dehydratase